MSAIPAMSAIPTSLCLRPSARDPTPHSALLQTKAQPQFDRAVTERSKPFFRVFQRSNLAQFQPSFSVFTVRSAEGRKAFQVLSTNLQLEASVVKDHGPRTHFNLEPNIAFYHLFALCVNTKVRDYSFEKTAGWFLRDSRPFWGRL